MYRLIEIHKFSYSYVVLFDRIIEIWIESKEDTYHFKIPVGSPLFQPYHTPQPPLSLGFHSGRTPSYPQPLPYAPPPSPPPYHAPFAPSPLAPYHAPYSSAAPTSYPGYSFAQPRPHPPAAHLKSSPYNALFTNDIREKNSRADKEDIYLKTEAELADMDFSGPFFYHYKSKSKHGNLGKQKKA